MNTVAVGCDAFNGNHKCAFEVGSEALQRACRGLWIPVERVAHVGHLLRHRGCVGIATYKGHRCGLLDAAKCLFARVIGQSEVHLVAARCAEVHYAGIFLVGKYVMADINVDVAAVMRIVVE